jgi:hypothetical protein
MSDDDEKVIFTDIEEECRNSIKKISDKFLCDKIYNSNDIGWMIDHLTSSILTNLKQISDNFKFVLTVVLLQNEESGFTQNNSLYFDNDTDGFICEKYTYENITSIYNLYCLAI